MTGHWTIGGVVACWVALSACGSSNQALRKPEMLCATGVARVAFDEVDMAVVDAREDAVSSLSDRVEGAVERTLERVAAKVVEHGESGVEIRTWHAAQATKRTHTVLSGVYAESSEPAEPKDGDTVRVRMCTRVVSLSELVPSLQDLKGEAARSTVIDALIAALAEGE